jgi:hypothetical protein
VEAVKGRRYWQGHEELSIYRRLLADDLPPLGTEEAAHPALSAIFERALAVDMNKRYRTAAEMREAIEDALRQMGSRVNRAAVSRCSRELFERERVAFDTAVRAELLRLRAGKRREALAVLNEPAPPSLLRESSGSLTATLADASYKADDVMVDFRPKWPFWRTVAWLSLGVGLAVAAWVGLRKAEDDKDLRPVAELTREPAARPPMPPPPFAPTRPVAEPGSKSAEPEAAADRGAPGTSPASVKVSASAAALPRPRPAPPRAVAPSPAPDELKRAPRAKRSLDQDDPWAE